MTTRGKFNTTTRPNVADRSVGQIVADRSAGQIVRLSLTAPPVRLTHKPLNLESQTQ